MIAPATHPPLRWPRLAALVTDAPDAAESDAPQLGARAVALKALLPAAAGTLTQAEMQLLGEWLDRLARPRD